MVRSIVSTTSLRGLILTENESEREREERECRSELYRRCSQSRLRLGCVWVPLVYRHGCAQLLQHGYMPGLGRVPGILFHRLAVAVSAAHQLRSVIRTTAAHEIYVNRQQTDTTLYVPP
jgi:hypothetical protein